MNPLSRLLGAATLSCVASAHAGVNSWTYGGPDAGAASGIAIHPANPQIALLATGRGIYRTTDGAAHWTLVLDGTSGPDLAFDPTNLNRVVYASSDLWISLDAGQTFSLAQAPSSQLREVEISSSGTIYVAGYDGKVFKSTDHANTWTPCAVPWSTGVAALTVDPNPGSADHEHLFVATTGYGSAPNATYRSTDGCATWTAAISGDPASPNHGVFTFAVMPGNSNRVLAAGDQTISLSTDGGANWTVSYAVTADWIAFDPTTPGNVIAFGGLGNAMRSTNNGDTWDGLFGVSIQSPAFSRFAFDPLTPGRMLAATYLGPYLSTNGGQNFALRATGLRAASVADFSTSNDGTVYAVFNPGTSGVFRRDPDTLQWSPLNNGALQQAISNYSSSFSMSHVATAPTDSSLIYAGMWIRMLSRSNDGGTTWQAPNSAFLSNGVSIVDTAIDPDSRLVAYSASDHGVWKTTDGGTIWAPANNGLPANSRVIVPAPGSDDVYVIANDPNDPASDAVYKSVDAGATWSATGALPHAAASYYLLSIALDPSDPRVVYVGYNAGVFKSVDGGASWTSLTFGNLPGGYASGVSVLIDPVYPGTITLARSYENSGVARTVDGGAHWERIGLDPGPRSQSRLLDRAVLDPLRPNVIIASVLSTSIAEYEVGTDLSLGVTGISGSLATSSTATATLVITNRGPHAASPSELTVALPAWLAPTVPASCTHAGLVLNCTVPALQFGDTFTVQLPVAVSASGGTGQFTASLATHETDTDPNNNNFSLAITGSELADLSLTLTPSAAAIDHDGPLTLTAVVSNAGPSPSSATTLSLQIPAGLTINSQSTTRGGCVRNVSTVDCTLGTLASGGNATITIQATGSSPGLQAISGHADSAGTDSGTDQDATTSITVRPVGDASVDLAESADPVRIGTSFTYTATIHNLSGDAAGVHLAMPVTGAKVKAAVPTSGTCAITATQVDCDVTSLAAGASSTVTINLDAESAGIATASATVTYAGTDTAATNNSATIGTTLRLEGDLAVTIADSVDPASTGVAFNYTVTVLNNGPNDGGVHLSVPVTGASVVSTTMPGATCAESSGTVTCDIASLVDGASATLTIGVSSSAAGSASATATATFGGTDLVSTNDSATASTTINNPPAPPSSGGGGGTSGGGGGGGGSLDWLALTLLGGLRLLRVHQRKMT